MYGKSKASLWKNLSTGAPQNFFSTIPCFVALVYKSHLFQNTGAPNEKKKPLKRTIVKRMLVFKR